MHELTLIFSCISDFPVSRLALVGVPPPPHGRRGGHRPLRVHGQGGLLWDGGRLRQDRRQEMMIDCLLFNLFCIVQSAKKTMHQIFK